MWYDQSDSSSPQFQSTVHMIAEDLKNIEENEIEDYPLVSIKDEELKLIFKLLDPTTLTKVFNEYSSEWHTWNPK